jgi:hypothetical protein
MDKTSVLAELARTVAAQAGRDSLPHRLCRAAVTMIGAEGASLTIAYTKPHRVTLCSTDDVASRLEDLQDVLGQGPGPAAYTSGKPVHLEVAARPVATKARWPAFEEAVLESLGPVLVLALPIYPDGEVLGVLTCHFVLGAEQRLEAGATQFLANAVGVALLTDPDRVATDMSGPWASRAEIHQAAGMVCSQLGVHPDDALALLRAHAFAHSWPLTRVAAAIVSRELDFSRSDPETETLTERAPGRTDTSDGTSPT